MAYVLPETGFTDPMLEAEVIILLQIDPDVLANFPNDLNKLRAVARHFNGGNAETPGEIRRMLQSANYAEDRNISFLDFIWHQTQIRENENNNLKVEDKTSETKEHGEE